MALKVVRDDITHAAVDAIVNPTNSALRPGGGADAAIHRAAGPELAEAVRKIGRLQPGQAAATDAFSLPCKYVIHTVGPRWFNGHRREQAILKSCYRESLKEAVRLGCRSVAIPLIASGSLGMPKDVALYTSIEEIRRFLRFHELDVTLVVYDRESFRLGEPLFQDIQSFIDQNYVAENSFSRRPNREPDIMWDAFAESSADFSEGFAEPQCMPMASSRPMFSPKGSAYTSLEDEVNQLDESFSEMLLRKIDESGMTDAQCYKKAGIDRKLFSKIRSDTNYHPSKTTVLSFVIALELSLTEAREMLEKAGFALSHSSKFDVIIEYFIRSKNFDLYEINQALFSFDQPLLSG